MRAQAWVVAAVALLVKSTKCGGRVRDDAAVRALAGARALLKVEAANTSEIQLSKRARDSGQERRRTSGLESAPGRQTRHNATRRRTKTPIDPRPSLPSSLVASRSTGLRHVSRRRRDHTLALVIPPAVMKRGARPLRSDRRAAAQIFLLVRALMSLILRVNADRIDSTAGAPVVVVVVVGARASSSF